MSILDREQADHRERLRRLQLRHDGDMPTDDVGFVGAFARSRYGPGIHLEPHFTGAYDGPHDFSTSIPVLGRSDEVVDDRMEVGFMLAFAWPRYMTVSLSGAGEGFTLWSGGSAEDVQIPSGQFLGTNLLSGQPAQTTQFWLGQGRYNEFANRYAVVGDPVPSDHFGDVGDYNYPRFRRFTFDFSAAFGAPIDDLWVLQVSPHSTEIQDLIDESGGALTEDDFTWTLETWDISFGEHLGVHLGAGTDDAAPRLAELLAASDGFELSADRRSLVIPPGFPGWYRAAGSVEAETYAGDTDAFSCAQVRIATGSDIVTYDALPPMPGADGDCPAGQAHALFYEDGSGQEVSLTIDGMGDVDPSNESPTGGATDLYVRNANLGVWRWFLDE